jgi:hypothetical protein
MSKVIASLLVCVSTVASAECYMRSSTTAQAKVDIQRVVDIRNMVSPTVSGKRCSATFRVQISGQWFDGFGAHEWNDDTDDATACKVAVELGKQEIISANFKRQIVSNQEMVCSDEPAIVERAVQVGDLIRESQVMPHPDKPKPFSYINGTQCKWYIETDVKGNDMYQWEGVICQVRPGTWKVLDKF